MKYEYKGEKYTFLDYIKVKSQTSREWDVHVLYEKDGLKYSREVGEFFERFKEVRPDFPPGWRDQMKNIVKEQVDTVCNHYWYYNFPSIPNKRICSHCKARQQLDLKSLKWTLTFTDSRSDGELIKAWVSQIECVNR